MRVQPNPPSGFPEFVAAEADGLLRAAWALTGDWHRAQDLVQTVLAGVWQRWSRVDEPAAYTRRMLYTTYISWWRRRWRGETPTQELSDSPDNDTADATVLRLAVRARLAQLTRRQRAVVVLRFFEDLAPADVAEVLGCSEGAVKSHTARALAVLRADDVLRDLIKEVLR